MLFHTKARERARIGEGGREVRLVPTHARDLAPGGGRSGGRCRASELCAKTHRGHDLARDGGRAARVEELREVVREGAVLEGPAGEPALEALEGARGAPERCERGGWSGVVLRGAQRA